MLKALELFSGIGGWKYALESINVSVEKICPFDISPVSNQVYQFSSGITPSKVPIDKLKVKDIDELGCNFWMMSPPCQPFTRNNQTCNRDTADPRAAPLLHLIEILPLLNKKPDNIIMENVVGFETSECCQLWLSALLQCGYHYMQFILTPTQFGVPNDRPRYYCLASLEHFVGSNSATNSGEILTSIPENSFSACEYEMKVIGYYLTLPSSISPSDAEEPKMNAHSAVSEETFDAFLVPESVINKSSAWCFDIVTRHSTRSACFTKSYGRYIKGTGSVLFLDENQESATQDLPSGTGEEVRSIEREDAGSNKKRKHVPLHSSEFLQEPSERKYAEDWQVQFNKRIRYFAPSEISRLFGFPEDFQFPTEISLKNRFSLLGNSLNVTVAQALLKYLFKLA